MNVVLHGWPDDPTCKRMHHTQSSEYQDFIVVPIIVCTYSQEIIRDDLIYRFIYHDGTHYHYELTESELA